MATVEEREVVEVRVPPELAAVVVVVEEAGQPKMARKERTMRLKWRVSAWRGWSSPSRRRLRPLLRLLPRRRRCRLLPDMTQSESIAWHLALLGVVGNVRRVSRVRLSSSFSFGSSFFFFPKKIRLPPRDAFL